MDRNKVGLVNSKIQTYVNNHSLRLSEHQMKLIEHTMKLDNNAMLGSFDEVQHFQLILKAIKAKKCIEVGVYTGYTTLSLAMALPDDGKVVACDITSEYLNLDIWQESGLAPKIDLRIGSAIETLEKLLADGEAETFDFAFIDADKMNYPHYYELCLKLVRKGGIIAIDNVIWAGNVVDDSAQDDITNILRKVNDTVKNDQRVDISMLTIGDGVTFCLKK